MVNKKGWLRIVEASISVVLILGAILLIMQTKQQTQERDLNGLIPPLLDEIAKNSTLRDKILMYDVERNTGEADVEINKFLAKMLLNEPSIDYNFRICEPEDVCPLVNSNPAALENMYTQERIITSTLERYGPKKLKIFLWNRAP